MKVIAAEIRKCVINIKKNVIKKNKREIEGNKSLKNKQNGEWNIKNERNVYKVSAERLKEVKWKWEKFLDLKERE